MARKTKKKPRMGLALLIERVMKAYGERPEKLAARLRKAKIRISSSSLYNFHNGRAPSDNMKRLLKEELEKLLKSKRKSKRKR